MAFDHDFFPVGDDEHIRICATTYNVVPQPDHGNWPTIPVSRLPKPPYDPGFEPPWDDPGRNTMPKEIIQVYHIFRADEPLPELPADDDITSDQDVANKNKIEPLDLSKPSSQEPLKEFHLFANLPAELRLKIWDHSFVPRAVELHSRRNHYADDWEKSCAKWKSTSRNPAALSVCVESREAALEFYTAALPIDLPLSSVSYHPLRCQQNQEDLGSSSGSGSGSSNSTTTKTTNQAVLYINPEHDTVVLLGDLHFTRLSRLLDWFREQEAARLCQRGRCRHSPGLRKLAMSTAPWAHDNGAATLRAFSRTVFRDIEEFVLFMYAGSAPPAEWNGGRCELGEVSPREDYYRRFLVGRGKQFVDSANGKGWMKVGKNEMRVAEIRFENGW